MADKRKTLRNKCDRKLQEIGREFYKECIFCGKPMQVMHHFYPKSQSNSLRYYWPNLVPLCQGCHFQHHNGNPEIHAKIIKLKGEKWLKDLQRQKLILTGATIKFYKETLEKLCNL